MLPNSEHDTNTFVNDNPDKKKPKNLKSEPGSETNDSTAPSDEKPLEGEFCTRIGGIRRQKDPHAFKCSCCSKRTMTLCKLNAHFISTHCKVNCDMCDQYFNTPSSLKKYKYTHSDEKYACRSCTSTNALTSSYNNNNNNYIEKLVIIM